MCKRNATYFINTKGYERKSKTQIFMDRQKLHAHLGLGTVVSWYGLRGKEYCEER